MLHDRERALCVRAPVAWSRSDAPYLNRGAVDSRALRSIGTRRSTTAIALSPDFCYNVRTYNETRTEPHWFWYDSPQAAEVLRSAEVVSHLGERASQ